MRGQPGQDELGGGGPADFFEQNLKYIFVKNTSGAGSSGGGVAEPPPAPPPSDWIPPRGRQELTRPPPPAYGAGVGQSSEAYGYALAKGQGQPHRGLAPLRMSPSQASTRSSDGRPAEAPSQVSSDGRAPSPMPGKSSSASRGSLGSGSLGSGGPREDSLPPRRREPSLTRAAGSGDTMGLGFRDHDHYAGRASSRGRGGGRGRSPSPMVRSRRQAPAPPPAAPPAMLSRLMTGMRAQDVTQEADLSVPYEESPRREPREPETDDSSWAPATRTGLCGVAAANPPQVGTTAPSSSSVGVLERRSTSGAMEERRCFRCAQAATSYFDHNCPKCSVIMCVSCLDDFRLIRDNYRCPRCGDEEANQEVLRQGLWYLNAYRSTQRTFTAFGESIGALFGASSSDSSAQASTTRSRPQTQTQRRGFGAACSGVPLGSGNSSGEEDVETTSPDISTRPPVQWFPSSLISDDPSAVRSSGGLQVETARAQFEPPPPPPPPHRRRLDDVAEVESQLGTTGWMTTKSSF